MRLDKFLANAGYGSRKEVKKLIKSGLVEVNGEINKSESYHIDEDSDKIYLDGELIDFKKYLYIMMNKPKDCLCANYDSNHTVVFDYIKEYEHRDLSTVGRLDKDTTGLLLISDDGKFIHSIINPKKKIDKVYHAYVNGRVKKKDIEYFQDGVIIDDSIKCLPAQLVELEAQEKNSWVEVIIQEGKFHQVKKMLKAINLDVLELKRIRIGNLELDDSLELGEYRLLSYEEILRIF